MNTSGHIKIGSLTRGMPVQANRIYLTTTSKSGNENFENFPETDKDGYKSLTVSLPYTFNPEKNFKAGKISFVKVNGIHKYRAEVVGASVYLYPYQPNFEDALVDLPVIKLGTAKKWEKNLNMQLRAIAYFYIGNDLFDFKTSSSFTIQEMTRVFKIISRAPASVLLQTDFHLLYKTKLFKTDKTEEVSYLTLKEPKLNIFSQELSEDVLSAIESKEDEMLKIEDQKPITLKQAEEFFGKKIVVELDNDENQAFDYSQAAPLSKDLIEKVEKIEKKVEEKKEKLKKENEVLEDNTIVLEQITKAGIPIMLAKGLVKNYGEEAFKKAESVEFNITDIVKLVSRTSK